MESNQRGQVIYHAYCVQCAKSLMKENKKSPKDKAFCEIIAKDHVRETGHNVIVGFAYEGTERLCDVSAN